MARKNKGKNKDKKKKDKKISILVTIVSYLAGYGTEIREEKQLELKDVTRKEAAKLIRQEREKLQDKLKKDYGGFWNRRVKGDVKSGRVVKVKEFSQRIVLGGKDYGKRVIRLGERLLPQKFSRREDAKIILLRQQGKSYRRIAAIQNRTIESVRSRIRRIEGRKK